MLEINFIRFLCGFCGFFLYFLINTATALDSENILNGFIAPEDKFKFYVSLRDSKEHFCGGAILDDYFIVTGAHCVINSLYNEFYENLITVAPRDTELDGADADMLGQVEKIYVPGVATIDIDDIAVLKLRNSLNLANNPKLSSVSPPEVLTQYEGSVAEVPGSGLDPGRSCSGNSTTCGFDPRLRYLRVSIVSNTGCRNMSDWVKPGSRHLCGTAHPISSGSRLAQGLCSGDSGGPLVLDGKILGIVSRGPKSCDNTSEPTLFTRIWDYLPFIRSAQANNRSLLIRVAEFDESSSSYVEVY